MATKPPSDAPFGLEPNVAAGLAYLLIWVGGLVMLFGGGTNKFVKWAAAQSIVLWVSLWIVMFVIGIIFGMAILAGGMMATIMLPIFWIIRLACFVLWLWTTITAFQGKEVRVPIIADLTQKIFGAQLA
jgi:uncharacterized membrane protein